MISLTDGHVELQFKRTPVIGMQLRDHCICSVKVRRISVEEETIELLQSGRPVNVKHGAWVK